jgi:hypothetical protein
MERATPINTRVGRPLASLPSFTLGTIMYFPVFSPIFSLIFYYGAFSRQAEYTFFERGKTKKFEREMYLN